jgi:hypothetical protein
MLMTEHVEVLLEGRVVISSLAQTVARMNQTNFHDMFPVPRLCFVSRPYLLTHTY